jgi:hypothetical protein
MKWVPQNDTLGTDAECVAIDMLLGALEIQHDRIGFHTIHTYVVLTIVFPLQYHYCAHGESCERRKMAIAVSKVVLVVVVSQTQLPMMMELLMMMGMVCDQWQACFGIRGWVCRYRARS